jgi:hypothetical protein
LLRDAEPKVVFASNPSLVLTLLLLALRPLFGYQLVSDAHYGGVVSVDSTLLQRILNVANRLANLVIVTTEGHAEMIRKLGGRAFVFPDPLPILPEATRPPAALVGTKRSVLFICSFDKDEPVAEVFSAAELLEAEGFRFFVSGRYSRIGLRPEALPHVTLLGYVDQETYHGFLSNVDVVVDLTTLENCLVCGAYEAMVASRPTVLSRTRSLTAMFTAGTVFTSHDPTAIAEAVRQAYARRDELRSTIPRWRKMHIAATFDRAQALWAAITHGARESQFG